MKESNKQVSKKAKGISIRFIAAMIVLLSIIYVLWQITDEIVLAKETSFDLRVFEIISRYTTPVITEIMLVITFFGSALFILSAYGILAAVLYLYKRNKILAVTIIIMGLASRLLLFVIKNIFRRDRPIEPLTPDVMGYSYPSGHSFSSFTLFGLLTYLTWKSNLSKLTKWLLSVFLISFAALIAFSRVYLHVHYASDVIAGFCLSLIWLTIILWVLEKMQKNGQKLI